MHISSLDKEHYTVISLSGRLDVSTAGSLSAYVTTLIREGKIFLIIDCTDLEYISSPGIGALLGIVKDIDNVSGKLLFAAFSPRIAEVVTIAGFDKCLKIYKAIEDAYKEMYRLK